jgi:hypothetical protein
MNLERLITEFMSRLRTDQIEVYNEFSLQHELGIFLRDKVAGYKVQFERNVEKSFDIQNTIKHEIDIVLDNGSERYAIELKFPHNGQYPEQMFAFVKDIRFMEEVKKAGFAATYCLTLVDDKKFYSGGEKQDGIYAYFRGGKPIHGHIDKPTGKKDQQVEIEGTYTIDWHDCTWHDCEKGKDGDVDGRYYVVCL